MCLTGLRVGLSFIPRYFLRLTSAKQTRSGRRYSAWDDDVARVIRIDVDASNLLQKSIEQEHNRDYADLASPEFTPTSLSPPPATPRPPLRKPFSNDSTTHTLSEVSRRLEALSTPPHIPSSAKSSINATAHALSRRAKRNASKRVKDQVRKGVSDESVDPLKERRKIRSSTSIKYARPRMIKVEFVVTALTIARYANVGVSRPADHSVPSLVELQKLHPDFTVIKNPEL